MTIEAIHTAGSTATGGHPKTSDGQLGFDTRSLTEATSGDIEIAVSAKV